MESKEYDPTEIKAGQERAKGRTNRVSVFRDMAAVKGWQPRLLGLPDEREHGIPGVRLTKINRVLGSLCPGKHIFQSVQSGWGKSGQRLTAPCYSGC